MVKRRISLGFLWLCGKKIVTCVMVDGAFGTVDHLVNKRLGLFEDFSQLSDIASVVVIKPINHHTVTVLVIGIEKNELRCQLSIK